MSSMKKFVWILFLLNVGVYLNFISADSLQEWNYKENTSYILDLPTIGEKKALVMEIEEDYAKSPVLESEKEYALDPTARDYKLLVLWKVLEERDKDKIYYVFYIKAIKDLYAVYTVDHDDAIVGRFLLSDYL